MGPPLQKHNTHHVSNVKRTATQRPDWDRDAAHHASGISGSRCSESRASRLESGTGTFFQCNNRALRVRLWRAQSRATSPFGWRQGAVSHFRSLGQPYTYIEHAQWIKRSPNPRTHTTCPLLKVLDSVRNHERACACGCAVTHGSVSPASVSLRFRQPLEHTLHRLSWPVLNIRRFSLSPTETRGATWRHCVCLTPIASVHFSQIRVQENWYLFQGCVVSSEASSFCRSGGLASPNGEAQHRSGLGQRMCLSCVS